MRRAFSITFALAIIAALNFPLNAVAAMAGAHTSYENSYTAQGGYVNASLIAQQRRRRSSRRRTSRRVREQPNRAVEQPRPSLVNDSPSSGVTFPNGPPDTFSVNEIDAAGLIGLLERSRMAADNTRRPLLVNFWATWCVPCREEFPDLVQLDAEFRPRGLEFITISLDEATERTTTVPAFLREMRATRMPAFLLNTPEPETAINAVDPTWSGALPATFLFDRNGQIVYKHFGRISAAETRAAIERALNASQ
jgi:thiol-disulfide isomerase/thioredoxin